MKKKLFQYAVLCHPKQKKNGEYDGETKTIIDLTTILWANENTLTLKIAREIPEEYMDKLDQVEIIVRSFH